MGDLVTHLEYVCREEGIEIEEEARVLIARRADGGMRDALSMLDQLRAFQAGARLTPADVRDAFGMQTESVYLNTLDLIARVERDRGFRLIQFLDEQGTDFVRFLEDLQEAVSALARVQEGGEARGWSLKAQAGLKERAGFTAEGEAWVRAEAGGTGLGVSTATWIEILALCQQEARTIRQASRASTLALTLIQRAMTLVETARGASAGAADSLAEGR
jgi:DNA polymerase III gamma/tau subunit